MQGNERAVLKEIEALRAASPIQRARTTERFLFYRLVALTVIVKSQLGRPAGAVPTKM
jgi:hypothetical protein